MRKCSKISALVCLGVFGVLVVSPSFLRDGCRVEAQEESTQTAPGGDALEKKTTPRKLLLKKVLEKKNRAEAEEKGDADRKDGATLGAKDLFGIEAIETSDDDGDDQDDTPDLFEILEAKDPGELDLWEKFLLHMKEEGHEEIIVEMGLDDVDNPVDFSQGDPIRGVLFRLSGDLLRLDVLFTEAVGKSLKGNSRQKALDAAETLRASEDPFLKVYGDYYQARLELEAALESDEPDETTPELGGDESETDGEKDPEREVAPSRKVDTEALGRAKELFLGLSESDYFLAQDEVRRYLAQIYLELGDPTLAILEWQLYLTELPRARQSERTHAEDEIRKIRESTEHPGPLHESAERMRQVSARLRESDVGETTQGEEIRLEEVLEKIAELLEKAARAGSPTLSMQGQQGQRSRLQQGQRQRRRQSQQAQQLARNRRNQQNRPQTPRDKQQHAGGQKGKTALRDPSEQDREAWGKINVRDVASSLKGVWDKIPVTYRQLVTQYFRDISDLEEGTRDRGQGTGEEKR